MRARTLAFAAVIFLAPPVGAVQKNAGENTAQFLSVGAGARALGMGEAYGPVAEGADAIYWNPAGLAQLDRAEFTYTRSEFSSFFHHDFAAFALPALGGAVGFSYTRLSQEDLPVVTNGNQRLGTFSPHSDAVALGYAHHFDLTAAEPGHQGFDSVRERWTVPGPIDREVRAKDPWTTSLLVGASVKYVSETLYDTSATAFAVDGGALFRPFEGQRVSFSAAFHNIGSKQRFISEAESLPAELDFGLAYDHRSDENRLVPALEIALPYYGSVNAKIGLEYSTPQGSDLTLAVRAGYKTLPAADLGPLAGATFGTGLRWKRFLADFGFEPMAGLGEKFSLTVGMSW